MEKSDKEKNSPQSVWRLTKGIFVRFDGIDLSEETFSGLIKLIKAHQTGQQIVLRARIILAAGQGQSNNQIARDLGVDGDTVRLWQKRWQMLERIPLSKLSIEERLEDLPGPAVLRLV